MSDVEVDKAALEGAIVNIRSAMGDYAVYANDIGARDTGGNPVGRTALRVMLENALGQASLEARSHHATSIGIDDRLTEINDSFTELDVSMGAGWGGDYVSDFS
ncbi:hypothetical protein [Microbacterium sp. XT11]|uniref:hypothetical protein n=1 Tax=Microbacterium sp. XT11 TaxID=367477 RepID=UPI00082D26B5|nr:hypothetical protein [Microbacterium sp. XT11]